MYSPLTCLLCDHIKYVCVGPLMIIEAQGKQSFTAMIAGPTDSVKRVCLQVYAKILTPEVNKYYYLPLCSLDIYSGLLS